MRSLPAAVRAAALAALFLLLALLLPAAVARAASYTVRSCSNGSISGWQGSPPARVFSTCRIGGGSLHARVEGAPGELAHWLFTAPADTDIEGFTVVRIYWRNAGVPFGTPGYMLQTFGSGPGYRFVSGNFAPFPVAEPPGIERAAGMTGQTALDMAVVCMDGGPCRYPAAALELATAAVELRDTFTPSIVGVGGSMLADGPLTGIRALRYTATDRGGGVARAELWIDGAAVDDQVADLNGGACVPVRGEFAGPVPCALRATNTLAFDTRRVPDGRHDLRLRVYDATGENHADWTTSIDVDNATGPVNRIPPSIAGRPREGETLLASPGTWSAARPDFTYRWQRDDDGWADVDGATSAAYEVSTDDVGHRLRVRVTATDAAGRGTAYSAPTERAVAGGPDGGATGGAGGSGASEGTPGSPGPAPDRELEISAALGAGERRSLTTAYGQAVEVRGRVRDAGGAPAPGVALSLLAAIDGRWRPAGATWTGADGRFTLFAGPGPSRRLVIAAGASRSHALRLAVRAPVTLRAARQGHWTVLRGALRGGHIPRDGVLVTVQARQGRRWVALTTLVTDRRGRFAGRVSTTMPVRAAVARQPGYPFAAGTSVVWHARAATSRARTAPRTAARTSR